MTGSLQAGLSGPTAPTRAHQTGRLSPRWRNLLLIVHIVVSVGVIGTDVVLVALGATGLVSGKPELIRAAYLVMGLLAKIRDLGLELLAVRRANPD